MNNIFKRSNTKCWQRCRETDILVYYWWKHVQTLSKNRLVVSYEVKRNCTIKPTNPMCAC